MFKYSFKRFYCAVDATRITLPAHGPRTCLRFLCGEGSTAYDTLRMEPPAAGGSVFRMLRTLSLQAKLDGPALPWQRLEEGGIALWEGPAHGLKGMHSGAVLFLAAEKGQLKMGDAL